MPVIIAGQSGASWGLSPETGIIAQHGTWETEIEENPSKNADGEYEMTSFYNPTQSIMLFGISLGIGLANAVVGVAISMTNAVNINGVGGGSIFVKKMAQSRAGTEFVSVTMNAVRRPLI